MLHLQQPLVLWALLPAVLLVLVAVARSRHELTLARKALLVVLRAALLLAVAVALARPVRPAALPGARQLVQLLDVSESVAPPERARAWERAGRDRAAFGGASGEDLVLFAGRAGAAGPDAKHELLGDPGAGRPPAPLPELDPARTDPVPALHAALARLRPGAAAAVVLQSDGNFTLPPDPRDLLPVAASGAQVAVVPLSTPRLQDLRLVALELPETVPQGEAFELRCGWQANFTAPARAILTIDGRPAAEATFRATPVPESWIAFPDLRLEPGRHVVRVELQAEEDEGRNNAAEGAVTVGERPRVLLVRRPGHLSAIAAALGVQGFRVEEGTPATLEGIAAIVLDDALPAQMPAEAIRDFVEAGGGLLVAGGSGGLHRWNGTALESVLPLHAERPPPPPPAPSPPPVVPPEPPPPAPETPPDRPGESGQAPEVKAREAVSEASTITLLLLLDKSPSMRGEKLRLAIEGARAAAATLAPTDRVGVLAFDDEPRWIVALGTLGDGGQFRSGVEKVQVESGTGTLFLPALNEAHRALKAERSRIRHLVLITDGDSSETEPTRIHRFRTLAGAMARDKITISTIGISIGSFNSSFLGSLVIWNRGPGRGGFTFTDNTNEIPQLLTAEADWALEAAGRRAPGGKEVPLPPGEGPVREPRPGPAPAPPTGPERPAETATPRAEEERPPSAEPTPPATGTPHAVELRARAPFFRGLTAPPFPPVVKWETASARRAAWVLLDVEGRDPLLAYRPYGKGKVLALATGIDDAAAPEWARWPELPALAAQAVRWLAPPPPAAIPRRVPPVHGPELAHTATDAVALERLARLTGGRVLSPAEPTPLPEGRPVERSAPLTLPCLGVAAALLVLDLLARRLG